MRCSESKIFLQPWAALYTACLYGLVFSPSLDGIIVRFRSWHPGAEWQSSLSLASSGVLGSYFLQQK